MEVLLVEQQVLVLAVHVYELLSQFAHGGKRYWSVVDEGPAFASGAHLTPYDAVFCIEVYVVVCEELFHTVFRQVEVGLYHTAFASAFDRLGVCALSEQQPDGSENDAFSRSGFSGDDREARVEVDVKCIDECEVLDV